MFLTCSIYSIRYVFHIFISYNLIFILCHSLVTSYILLTYIFMFHAYYIWHFIYLYNMMTMYSHLIHVFLFLYDFTLLRNWNHSNRIIQTKVMTFSCQTSQFTDYTRDSLYYSFFWGLNFIFDTSSLYSIKSKVLRVLFQLESPNSEHRNSRYDLDTRDYSMFKLMRNLT